MGSLVLKIAQASSIKIKQKKIKKPVYHCEQKPEAMPLNNFQKASLVKGKTVKLPCYSLPCPTTHAFLFCTLSYLHHGEYCPTLSIPNPLCQTISLYLGNKALNQLIQTYSVDKTLVHLKFRTSPD